MKNRLYNKLRKISCRIHTFNCLNFAAGVGQQPPLNARQLRKLANLKWFLYNHPCYAEYERELIMRNIGPLSGLLRLIEEENEALAC